MELKTRVVQASLKETSSFDPVSELEGESKVNIRYIEEKSGAKVSVQKGEASPTIHVIAENEDSLERAESLIKDLVETLQRTQMQQIQENAMLRMKRKKKLHGAVELPTQVLLAMKYYFPGEPPEPPPPGSSRDLNARF